MRRDLQRFMQQVRPRRAQTFPPSQDLKLDESVSEAVIQLFRGKCAFCERRTYVFPHRFRPLENALPLAQVSQAHLYYCWLGTDWSNVYSICDICSGSSRGMFPVGSGGRGSLPTELQLDAFATENAGVWRWPHRDRPLVLDPCRTRAFARFLSFDLQGVVKGLEPAGHETISLFQLNRPDLIAERATAFAAYVDMIRRDDGRKILSDAFDFESIEFGGGWYILLRRIVKRLEDRLGIALDPGRTRIHRSIERVLSTPRGRDAFAATLDDVQFPAVGKEPSAPVTASTLSGRRIVRVDLENFKSLETLSVDISPPVPADPDNGRPDAEASASLLLGENAAGKSSVLEAVALTLSAPEVRKAIQRPWDAFVLDPLMMGATRGGRARQAKVQVHYDDGEQTTLTIDRGFQDEGQREGLPRVFAYGAFRQYSERGERFVGGGTITTLFRSELVLRNPEEWLLSLDAVKFPLVARALGKIFSLEGDYDLIEPDRPNRRCLIRRTVGDGAEAVEIKSPLSAASSGFRSVLAMVCDVFEGVLGPGKRIFAPLSDAQPVILIDEIEAHLHPRWKMRIITALRQVLPSATFIFTSHDPLCLRGMHDGEVVVLRQVVSAEEDTDRLPIFVESVTDLPNVDNLTIEQLLTSDMFDMFTTDSIQAELNFAEMSSLLALRDAGVGLPPAKSARLRDLEADVLSVLPLGTSKIRGLVMEAVAEYLQKRPGLPSRDLEGLEKATKALIVDALESYR